MPDSIQKLIKNIGTTGDYIWYKVLNIYRNQNLLIEGIENINSVLDTKDLKARFLVIPEVDFSKTRMDICYKHYFYSRIKEYQRFVIEYKEDIQTYIKKYSGIVAPLGNQSWQVLAKIDDVFNWRDESLFVKIVCFRLPGRITAVFNSGYPLFIGQDKLDLLLRELDTYPIMLQM